MRPLFTMGLVVLALAQLPLTVHPQGQTGAPLAGARFEHVAIAARDASRAVQELAGILGVVPSTSNDGSGTFTLSTADLRIDVTQPAGDAGPTHAFLDRHGPGIEHLGFAVAGPIVERVRALEQRGGQVIAGDAAGPRALVAFPTAGLTIEIVRAASAPAGSGASPSATALGSRKMSHVGFVYRDAQPAIATLATLLGIPAPSLTTFTPIDYRPGDASDRSAHVRYAFISTGGVGIEVIEPVGGPSPWMDFVTARPSGGAHHLAFTFTAQDDGFDATVRHLQAKGGRWRKGMRGVEGAKSGSSPEFEFLATLGLVIEVTKSGV